VTRARTLTQRQLNRALLARRIRLQPFEPLDSPTRRAPQHEAERLAALHA